MTLYNLNDAKNLKKFKIIDADICIIGAGIAGLSIAESLKGSGIKICIFEAGSKNYEINNSNLFDVKNIGKPHRGSKTGRFRVFGGSSTRWGGQALPFKKEIFLDRSYINIPKWVLNKEELEPYIKKAEKFININNLSYEKNFIKYQKSKIQINSKDINVRFSKWAPFRSRNFAKNIGKNCIKDSSISLFLNATASYINLFKDLFRNVCNFYNTLQPLINGVRTLKYA